MTQRRASLSAFFADESGALYGVTSHLAVTMAVSIPVGLLLYAIYDTLSAAGRYSNFVLGLF